jgi:hypothetical protein
VNKESAAQIRMRLLNHCRFWEMYFTWALNNHIQYIDVRSTPTPVKIYGNGFGLKPFSELPDAWKMYFYDEEDCRAASEKIQYVFNKTCWHGRKQTINTKCLLVHFSNCNRNCHKKSFPGGSSYQEFD